MHVNTIVSEMKNYSVIIRYNKITVLVCCYSPLALFIYISLVSAEDFQIALIPCLIPAAIGSIIYGLSDFLLKKYFDEFVFLSGENLIHRGPKASGSISSTINLKNAKEILWENECFTSGPGSRNSLYIVDGNNEKHVLVKNKLAGFLSIQKTALFNLSEVLNIKIQKDYYSLSSDMKRRRLIKNA